MKLSFRTLLLSTDDLLIAISAPVPRQFQTDHNDPLDTKIHTLPKGL